MFRTAKNLVSVDAPQQADANRGRSVFTPVRISVPESLRREILECRASISNRRPATLAIAAPVLTSIYFHWSEELPRINKAALATIASQGIDIPPATVKSQEQFVVEFIVRDFQTWEPATPARIAMLFGIFDRALRGQLNLWKDEPAEQPEHPPRRWTLRWWKILTRDIFRACLCCFPGSDSTGGTGCGVIDASPVPPVSLPVLAPSFTPSSELMENPS